MSETNVPYQTIVNKIYKKGNYNYFYFYTNTNFAPFSTGSIKYNKSNLNEEGILCNLIMRRVNEMPIQKPGLFLPRK